MKSLYIGFAIWLFVLTAIVAWIFAYFRRLSKVSGKGNIKKLVEKILDKQDNNAKNINSLERELRKIKDGTQFYIQKVSLVRFNPFQELGGDHSFSLALLDGKDNGFVITGLHARERTRVYVKEIKKGKSKVSLSDEEVDALKTALRSKNNEK